MKSWLVACCITPLLAQAQAQLPAAVPASAAAPRPAPLLEGVRALGLPTSSGRITAHHAVGADEKALRLRQTVEAAMDFYRERLGVELPLHMAVLNRAQWGVLVPWQPYGIPGVAGQPPVIFMPAGDDGLAAEDALALKGRAKPDTQALLARSGLSFDEAARRYVDLVGLHELGHAMTRALGIRVPSRWLDEWLATYFAYAFLRERQPLQAHVWDGILQTYLDAVQPAHTTLADFDRLYFGVGANNYVWYQAQFQRRVAQAYEAHGLALVAVLREVLSAPTAEGAPALLSPATLIERLEPRLPGFRAWAAGFEATRPR